MRRSDIKDPLQDYIIPTLTPRSEKLGAKFFLFGSRAKGTATPYSDRDIGYQAKRALSVSELHALQALFEESPRKVDIVDFSKKNNNFSRLAKKNTIPLL